MDEFVVPSTYRNCSCEQGAPTNEDYDFFFGQQLETPCSPQYRSLKFRNKTSGAILLHKAVVRSCLGEGEVLSVNQTLFNKEEHEYQIKRGLEKLEMLESSYSSWVFGFRTNLLKFYKKHDGHLRFG